MVQLVLQLFLRYGINQSGINQSMGPDLSNLSGSSPCTSWLVLPLLVLVLVPAVLLGVARPPAPDIVDLRAHRLARLSSLHFMSHPAGGQPFFITSPPGALDMLRGSVPRPCPHGRAGPAVAPELYS